MARTVCTLSFTFTPAFHGLVELAEQIAQSHGEERARDWADRVLRADFDMFCTIGIGEPADRRTVLTLITGGLAE